MANRSYLFAADCVPPIESAESRARTVGISEFSYEIPIVFKILLSRQPRPCRSLIWDLPDDVALAGDYAQGVAALQEFLDRIERPQVEPLKQEAMEFLTDEANRRKYFILECTEIFEMDDGPIPERNAGLLREIESLDASIESTLSLLSKAENQAAPTKRNKFLTWLMGSKPPAMEDALEPYYRLGLGFWDNVLFYSPADAED